MFPTPTARQIADVIMLIPNCEGMTCAQVQKAFEPARDKAVELICSTFFDAMAVEIEKIVLEALSDAYTNAIDYVAPVEDPDALPF